MEGEGKKKMTKIVTLCINENVFICVLVTFLAQYLTFSVYEDV